MDEVDEAIVGFLEVDGRLTHREIAHAVGLSRSAAAARVQRLSPAARSSSEAPYIPPCSAVAHWPTSASSWTDPRHRWPREIARRDDVPFLSLTGGPHALVAEIRSASAA